MVLFDTISFFIMFMLSFKSWSIFIIAVLRSLSADSIVAVIFVCFCWLFCVFFLLSIIPVFLLHLMASFFYSVLPVWMQCCWVSGLCYLPLKNVKFCSGRQLIQISSMIQRLDFKLCWGGVWSTVASPYPRFHFPWF